MPTGEDPRDVCPIDPPGGCQRDGTCDGNRACRLYTAGAVCAGGACQPEGELSARSCDGAGFCRPALVKTCAPYRCVGTTCAAACAGDADCVGEARCDPVSKRCTGLLAAGSACSAANACLSGVCVDGLCCTTACSGACEACNVAGSMGVCAPVPSGMDPAEECQVDATNSCGRDGSCDGKRACRVAGAGVECAPPRCTASVQTPASRCDGAESCVPALSGRCAVGHACSGATCAPHPLAVGLVGLWRFDEGSGSSAAEEAAGSPGGQLTNGASWSTGRFGQALDVQGGDTDYVIIPRPLDGRLDFGTGDFTVSLWIKTTQAIVAGSVRHVAQQISNSTLTGWEVVAAFDSNQPQISFKVWSGASKRVSANAVHDGRWHHLVGRKTAAAIELYIDGVLRSTDSHALGTVSTTTDLKIGGLGASGSDFDGQVDELRLYKRALSTAEIAALGDSSP